MFYFRAIARTSRSLPSFKSKLKTHLFKQSFPHSWFCKVTEVLLHYPLKTLYHINIKHFDWLLLCVSWNLHRYVIVFDHCWKFYPKSNIHGRRGHGGPVDWSFNWHKRTFLWFWVQLFVFVTGLRLTGGIKITVNTPTIKITHSVITQSIAHVNLHSYQQMSVPLS